MGWKLEVRELEEGERKELERRSRTRTEAARVRQRAEMVLRKVAGESLEAIGRELGVEYETVARWIHRFNADGLAGLEERSGRGRRRQFSELERGQLIQTARTAPSVVGQAFASWTLERLRVYAETELGITISRAQLGRVLVAEGLRWYQERSYFTESPDPEFAEKRGQS